ncbi:MAG TPA: pyridoxal phosphate-dependent aminotransferase [Bacteroidales bacterium]|mgnify:CR=1 FL=1|jgi:aspartate aminotransferase|nr:pyridoxal phosphate-dependent aminotransferase [Bacteroidales bacterium]HOB27501.1 pyridoxal phosphate-dependent aminotransferase [Bacteroidales bacterium]HOK21496.1 pyridoxal phosphate-dependent aminotransferase [Bacteroidales bacterium]HOL74413.1 pyridoxal phosphate-dependent aminotransferase [Bacteroidales bacterium]HPU46216.1 pyridoxal phosphate-dependent aminotransferase [Bacteroidales bacterium]
MLSISKKGQMMPPSPIRKLVPYADAAKKRGIKVYHLNIGQPDIETPKIALDALKNINLKVIEYSHSAGILSFREKLCKYYEENNIHVTPDDIIVTTGGSEAILFTFGSIMDNDDEVIIPEPYYANYNGFAINAGVKVVPVMSHIEENYALPPIEEFEKYITPKTKAILICNPNNPTGYLYSREEIEKLGELVKKHNLFLIADEVYREFVYDGTEHFSVMHLKGIEQNTILVDSVSKRYSACGFRIGMVISKNKDVMTTAMKFAQARLSPPTFGQIAAEAAIDVDKSYFEAIKKEYVARRNVVIEGIKSIPGAYCPTPKGAFYVMAKLPIDDSDKFCQWLLEKFNENNETVMLAPATGFYSVPERGLQEVRISYVLNVDDMKRSMELLKKAIEVYPGRK